MAALIGRRLVKRKIRRVLAIALPVSGMGIIFGSVLYGASSLQLQVLFVLFGVLVLEAGVWGLANRLLWDERRPNGLREEGDHFIGLIRELSEAAIAGEGTEDDAPYRNILEQMHTSVRRMGELAGQDAPAREAEASNVDTPVGPAGRRLDTVKTQ